MSDIQVFMTTTVHNLAVLFRDAVRESGAMVETMGRGSSVNMLATLFDATSFPEGFKSAFGKIGETIGNVAGVRPVTIRFSDQPRFEVALRDQGWNLG